MTHKIIKTENYLLVVDDSEMSKDNYHYNPYTKTVHKGFWMAELKECRKIIAHLPLNNSPVLEGVPLLPPLEDDEAICPYPEEKQNAIDWHNGYNKVKVKYKYTEKDIEYLYNLLTYDDLAEDEKIEACKKYIKSLQQPKMPVAFECEWNTKQMPEFHQDEPKTTTNSQGQTVLVGKYIY